MQPFLLPHLLAQSAARCPDQAAVLHDADMLSYAELHAQSTLLAAALRWSGVQTGERIALMSEKSPQAVIALYGVLAAGAAYVPIDPLSPAERVRGILKSCGIRLLFASATVLSRLDPAATTGLQQLIVLDGAAVAPWPGSKPLAELLAGSNQKQQLPDFSDGTPAYILHTSGSTGAPKGVVITHRNALAFVEMAAAFFRLTPQDRVASHAPFHFDLSVFDLFAASRAGATVVLVPEMLGIFPARLAAFMDAAKITVWNSVASVLALLAERGNLAHAGCQALRLVLFSGEPLPAKFLRVLMQHLPQADFYNIYGQTEANSSTCYQVTEPPAEDGGPLPIGKPFPNFEVFALNNQGQSISRPGEIGEFYISSATVARGYWRDRERSAERFVPDPRAHMCDAPAYRTGDLVTLDEHGNFVFLGRFDHQVKVRGYRVNLAEIDAVLHRHPQVVECLTVALPHPTFGNSLCAFVRRAGGDGGQDLLEHCGKVLPPYMLPETITSVEDFPRTATGKIDRAQLLERLAPSGDSALPGEP
jgi:amino acid adenylation domain-containing protein